MPADFLVVRIVACFAGFVQGKGWVAGPALDVVSQVLRLFPFYSYYLKFLKSLPFFASNGVRSAHDLLSYFDISDLEIKTIIRFLFVDNRLKIIKILTRNANSVAPGEVGALQLLPDTLRFLKARTLYRIFC